MRVNEVTIGFLQQAFAVGFEVFVLNVPKCEILVLAVNVQGVHAVCQAMC